jgi:4-methyl-5(b-hydroxyethyl)-thiazole monophosphate biosynthesis
MSKVLIPLAQGCEELEAVTIIDLLRRAGIEVVTASLTDEPVVCSRQTVLLADTTLDAVLKDDFDLMVLPGGLPGADHLNADQRIHTLLDRLDANDRYVAAICAAPRVLVDHGLLNGKKATAYPGALAQHNTDQVEVTNAAVEIQGNVITSRGPGTAMDFALTLIELLAGKAIKEQVEQGLVRDI